MKKVLMAILICLFYGTAFGAYDNTAVCTATTIDNGRERYSCAFDTTVAAGTAVVGEFRINADDISGRLIELRWLSASTDCDIWVAESVDAVVTDQDVIFSATAINLGAGYTFSPTISYDNTSSEAWLYVTIRNDDAVNATGTSAILILIYERY